MNTDEITVSEPVTETVQIHSNGGTLLPWQNGQSGNPSGKPKGRTNRLTAYKRILELNLDRPAIEALLKQGNIDVPNGIKQLPNNFSVEEALVFAQTMKGLTGDTKAFQAVRDEIHGKIADRIEIENTSAARDALIKLVNSIHGEDVTSDDVKQLSYAHPAVYELPEDKQAEVVAEVCRELGVIELVENDAGEFEAENG